MAHKRKQKDEAKEFIPKRHDKSHRSELMDYQKKQRKYIFFAVVAVLVAGALSGMFIYLFVIEEGGEVIDFGKPAKDETNPEDIEITSDDDTTSSGNPRAVITVEGYGVITIELRADSAPIAVDNFVNLATNGFYNGLIFHRIAELESGSNTHIIQGGGYRSGGQYVGDTSQISWENSGLLHNDGAIAMASTGAKTGGSCQFYLCDGPQHFLDSNYEVFGYVISGLDVVRQLGQVSTHTNQQGEDSEPDQEVIIQSIEITE
jgi:cyclophilin family peptidyl-prolyl cis-trans isomerase